MAEIRLESVSLIQSEMHQLLLPTLAIHLRVVLPVLGEILRFSRSSVQLPQGFGGWVQQLVVAQPVLQPPQREECVAKAAKQYPLSGA